MVSIWDTSYGNRAKAWDSSGLDLCGLSLFKVLTADKGTSETKGQVISTVLLGGGMGGTCSDDMCRG